MSFQIYLSPPDVGELEEEFVLDAIRSGWVAPLGPHVDAFEREIADFVGVKYAVAVSSGTAALHLALLALGVRPGDEIVVPTMTFAATAFAVNYAGGRPVFLDSEPLSWNLDPDGLRLFLERRKRDGQLPAAVIVVDIFGQAANYEPIVQTCEDFGIPLIEDAAEALGASHRGRMAGSFGSAAVFSFNGNKIMTTGGGGMLVTDDSAVSERVRHLATQARDPVPWYQHSDIGFNYRMSNVLAAIGRAQLRRLPFMVERRRQINSLYRESFRQVSGVEIVREASWGRGNAWLTLVLFDEPQSAASVRNALNSQGIEGRHAWRPLHLQPVFANEKLPSLPVAERLFAHGLCLPSGSTMSDEDVRHVATAVVRALG